MPGSSSTWKKGPPPKQDVSRGSSVEDPNRNGQGAGQGPANDPANNTPRNTLTNEEILNGFGRDRAPPTNRQAEGHRHPPAGIPIGRTPIPSRPRTPARR
ncbi:hypothetical protein Q9189_003875 [Teloschistes chrysophthalmus]